MEDQTTGKGVSAPVPPVPGIDLADLENDQDARLQQRLEQRMKAVYQQGKITGEQAGSNVSDVRALKAYTSRAELDLQARRKTA